MRDFVESPDIGGTLAAANMGPMDAFGVSYTDDWIDGFQGANVAYADDDKTSGWWQDGDGLLGGLTCLASDTYANIGEPVPAIPHAQYYAETGKAHAVPLDAIEDALDSGTADDFVGIVWHPMGYDSVPAGSVPIGANRIDALLDALDTRGIASATVSETVAGATAAC